MRNKLSDLNNHLFAQLERLSDEEITGENLTTEIERSRAVVNVAGAIISNGSLTLKAFEISSEINGWKNGLMPEFLGVENG